MDTFCISSDLLRTLWFMAFGAACVLLVIVLFGFFNWLETPSKSDQIVEQIRAQDLITRTKADSLTEQYKQKMAQGSEELKRKRKMNQTEAEAGKT